MSSGPGDGIKYWGILCRTCSQPVTFGTGADREARLGSLSVRPGAVRCASGHNHIYFPRDFLFFVSLVAIPDALIRQTVAAYQAINPMPAASSNPEDCGVVLEDVCASEAPLDEPMDDKPTHSSGAVDLRRERAQTAAKRRWASWAIKKSM